MMNGLALDKPVFGRYFLYLLRCRWLEMVYTPLKLETVKHQALKRHLLDKWPDCDEETLRDTLEGITDLHEMIAAVIRSALVDEALGSGLRARLDDMRERQSRLEVRASKKRELALQAMSETGPSSSNQTLRPRPARACPASSSYQSKLFPRFTGCRNHPSSIARVYWVSSSVVALFPASSSAIQSLHLW